MPIIRAATAADVDFLEVMLAVAADWQSETPRSSTEVMADPALAHYIVGWPRAGDEGVVAVDDDVRIGAAWWRFLDPEDAGYGFVNRDTPEITLAVVATARRAGVGAKLLRALVERADERGLPALSLSVAAGNHAVRLYERVGFQTVGTTDGSHTMMLRLR